MRSMTDVCGSVCRPVVFCFVVCFVGLGAMMFAAERPASRRIDAETLAAVNDAWQSLLNLSRDRRRERETAAAADVERAGIELGTWYCAGPFKDMALGLHWRSFNVRFEPEQQVLAAGADPIDLSRTWEVERLPGEDDTTRRWVAHPEWTDGYCHQLPMGPPPSWNETVYLYRTITAKSDVTVDVNIHGEDDVRVWINGSKIGEAYRTGTSSRFPASLKTGLRLTAGENRLLVKVTCMHGARSFAFALPGITPYNDFQPGDMIESVPRFAPGNEPFATGARFDGAEVESRYRAFLDKKRTITNEANHEVVYNYYAGDLLDLLSLPEEARDLLPPAADAEAVSIVRELYYRASRRARSLERVRRFAFDVPIVPMYDPPRLKMHEVLKATVPGTAGGEVYLNRLAVLKAPVQEALTAVDQAEPGATEAVFEAERAIEAMWGEAIRGLGPIAFVKYPPYGVNAIAPYTAEGNNPASICVFDPARPTEPPREIYHDVEGTIFDMNVSYDGKTLFFSARRGGLDRPWHIYEIGVDGRGLRQITHGTSDNISPAELPSGEIIFVSTRAGTFVNCQSETAGQLYVARRDGSGVRRVSGNTHSDHTPQVMNDGRVLFTRWDYGVDKNVFVRQSLWSMNPDGTRLQLYSGNTIENPNSFWEARPIPGRPEVVCVFGPHHEHHAGMIGLVWNQLGIEAPRGEGFRWITQELPIIEDISLEWGYQDPFPVNERQFLVSYGGDGQERNRIYLVDDRGNKKCIYEDAKLGCWDPVLLRPRARPPVIVPTAKHSEFVFRDPTEENQHPEWEMGTFLLQDVYQGLEGQVARGEIKSLAIMEQLSKTGYPRGSDIWGYSPTIGRGTMFVRRLIGTVPVEEDGSAHFLAPAIKDISLNALDAEGRALKRMGSTIHIMPGEVQSCIGCHESRYMSPPYARSAPLAAQRSPSVPKTPDWGTGGIVDFVRVVQPVLDRHCSGCHSGATPDGGVDLSGDKTRLFNMGYNQLVDRGMVDYANMNGTHHTQNVAKSVGSLVSRIRDIIESDHAGEVLPLADRQRIYTWIDAGIPYYGTYTFTNSDSIGGRGRWYAKDRNGWFQKDFLPVFRRRCVECHSQKARVQVYNYGPRREVTVTSKLWDDRALMTPGFVGHMMSFVGPMHRINLTHPEWSPMLTAPLAKEAGGLGLCREADGREYVFEDTSDPDYQIMLKALEEGGRALEADPRVDMIDPSLWQCSEPVLRISGPHFPTPAAGIDAIEPGKGDFP